MHGRWFLAVLAATVATTACKKVDDGQVEVDKPVVGTTKDTVSMPTVDVGTQKDTIRTPKVTTESTEVTVPKVKVNPPE